MAFEEMNMTAEEQTAFSRLVGRRAFLGATAGATLSALVGHEPRLLHAQGSRPNATADAVIVLWMAGGMAQTETWDPKRYTPFEPGVRTERVLSTFPSIDTAVDHIKISQGLERVARVMNRGAIIRTFQAADLGYILPVRGRLLAGISHTVDRIRRSPAGVSVSESFRSVSRATTRLRLVQHRSIWSGLPSGASSG